MEQQIVEFLKSKYNPLTILLYGSRSTDIALEHSDWDLVCLTSGESGSDSFEFDGENIDLDIVHYPLTAEEMVKHFDGTLQTARVLFDDRGQGQELLTKVLEIYAKGRNLTTFEFNMRKQFLQRRYKKLQQSQDNEILFAMHLGVFLEKMTQAWFEILNNRWRTSLRSRLVEIQKQDPDFHEKLTMLAGSKALAEKLDIASGLIKRIQIR